MPLLLEMVDPSHRDWLAGATKAALRNWLHSCQIRSNNFQWDVATGTIVIFLHPHDIDRDAAAMNTIAGIRASNISNRPGFYISPQPTVHTHGE
jgi:hypothetical protein